MQRDPNKLLRASLTRRMPGGRLLLLLYVVTFTPLAPGLTALLAASDRSHHVAVEQTTNGLQILLRHDHLDVAMHQHGMVARALTVFALHSTAPQSDHVIQFGAIDTPQLATAIRPAMNLPACDGNPMTGFVFQAADLTAELAASPRPPPVSSGLLLTVRSPVLLI